MLIGRYFSFWSLRRACAGVGIYCTTLAVLSASGKIHDHFFSQPLFTPAVKKGLVSRACYWYAFIPPIIKGANGFMSISSSANDRQRIALTRAKETGMTTAITLSERSI